MSRRISSRSGCCQGAGNAGPGHFFKLVFFLVLFKEYLLWSVDMYSKMIAVQFDDVDQALVSVDVFSIIVRQKCFLNVVYQFLEVCDGELLFFK